MHVWLIENEQTPEDFDLLPTRAMGAMESTLIEHTAPMFNYQFPRTWTKWHWNVRHADAVDFEPTPVHSGWKANIPDTKGCYMLTGKPYNMLKSLFFLGPMPEI